MDLPLVLEPSYPPDFRGWILACIISPFLAVGVLALPERYFFWIGLGVVAFCFIGMIMKNRQRQSAHIELSEDQVSVNGRSFPYANVSVRRSRDVARTTAYLTLRTPDGEVPLAVKQAPLKSAPYAYRVPLDSTRFQELVGFLEGHTRVVDETATTFDMFVHPYW